MRIMVIGASTHPEKFGHKAVRAFLRAGHTPLPVNPHAEQVAGVPAFRAIPDVPGPIDRATLYVHPDVGLEAVRQLAARGDVKELWVSPGAESDELVAEAQRLGFQPVLACAIVDVGQTP